MIFGLGVNMNRGGGGVFKVRHAHLHHKLFEVARGLSIRYFLISRCWTMYGASESFFETLVLNPALEKFLYDNKCVI